MKLLFITIILFSSIIAGLNLFLYLQYDYPLSIINVFAASLLACVTGYALGRMD